MINQFILITVILLHLMMGRFVMPTRVKAFQYRKVTDGSMVEWSDDFPTYARVEFSLPKPINLRMFCGLAIGCDGKPGDFVKICWHDIVERETKCVNVTAKKKNENLKIFNATMSMVFDVDKGEAVGTLNVPKTTFLGAIEFYCESSASAGRVWRKNNRLMVIDVRDYFSDEPITRQNVSKDGGNQMSCSSNHQKAVTDLFEMKDFFPNTFPKVEFYLCPDKNWEACYKNKENDIYKVTSFLAWHVTVTNDADLKLNMHTIPDNVVSALNGKYLSCFVDGELAQPPAQKVSVSEPQKRATHPPKLRIFTPDKSSPNVQIWNDTSVNVFNVMLKVDPSKNISSLVWTYTGSAGTITLDINKRNEKLNVEVGHDGGALIFSGPYSSHTNGKYSIKVSSGGEVKDSFLSVKVFPYLVSSPKFIPATLPVDSEVKAKCSPTLISSVPLISSMSLYGDSIYPTEDKAKYDDFIAKQAKRIVKQASSKYNRSITVDITKHVDNKRIYPSIVEKGYSYKAGRENCYTINCKTQIAFEDSNTFSFHQETVNVMAPPPFELKVNLKSDPCENACQLVCAFNLSEVFKRMGIISEYEWDVNDQIINADAYSFSPLPIKLLKIKVTLKALEPGSRRVLLTKVAESELDTANITLAVSGVSNIYITVKLVLGLAITVATTIRQF